MALNDHNAERPLRILLIGSLPPPLGGTSVSFANLVEELQRHEDVEITVIDTGRVRGRVITAPFRLLRVLFQIIWLGRRADSVSAHLCDGPLAYLGLFILWVCQLMRKPLVLRKFGGNWFKTEAVSEKLALYVSKRADAFLLQTKMLLSQAKQSGFSNIHWYSTSRPKPPDDQKRDKHRNVCRRFVFLGHVNRVKGMMEILKVGKTLPSEVSVDVYGPFTSDLSEEDFDGQERVHYRGILSPDDVPGVLSKYDALLLPTYHPGEGYPGVVIEAFFTGIPVVCSNWQALPEIVDDTCGILVEPHDSKALQDAMQMLVDNSPLFQKLCRGSSEKAAAFSSSHWANEFVKICRDVVERKK